MSTSYVWGARHTSAIRRLGDGPQYWRVLVEAWQEQGAVHGKLLFRPAEGWRWQAQRESATLLQGQSFAEVVALAHDLPEDRLRRVLHSLG